MAKPLHSRQPIVPPEYMVEASVAYRKASRDCARRSIELAASAIVWHEELNAAGVAKKVARKEVRQFLFTHVRRCATFVSRILGLVDLIPVLQQNNLKLDFVNSEGVIFLLVDATRARLRQGSAIVDLPAMVADAATLTGQEFKAKWPPLKRRQRPLTFDVTAVCRWLEKDASVAEIDAIVNTLSQLNVFFGSSQI